MTNPYRPPTAVNHPHGRSLHRLVLGGLLIVLGVAALVFYAFVIHDIEPPDEGRYLIEFDPQPEGINPIAAFTEVLSPQIAGLQRDWFARWNADTRVLHFEPGVEPSLRDHLDTFREAHAASLQLVENAQPPLRHPEAHRDVNQWDSAPHDFCLQEGANLIRRSALLDSLEGRQDRALLKGSALVRFSGELSRADGDMMNLLIASSMQLAGLALLQTILPRKAWLDTQLADLQDVLRQAQPLPADLARTLRVTLLSNINVHSTILQSPERWPRYFQEQPRMDRWLFKPHKTSATELTHKLPLISAVQTGWLDGLSAAKAATQVAETWNNQSLLRRRLVPNGPGQDKVFQSLAGSQLLLEHVLQTMLANRCLDVALALRRHEQEHGFLPEQLDALVPQYLPQLPEDTFSGEALLWNASTQRLYSVGPDKKELLTAEGLEEEAAPHHQAAQKALAEAKLIETHMDDDIPF